jgi:hypothetical protein
MPIIPTSREEDKRTVSSPVPVGASDYAGTAGRGIAQLGAGLEGLGDSVYKEEQNIQKQADHVSQMEGENDLQNAYKVATDQAVRSAKPDGSDLQDKFNEAFTPAHDSIMGRYADNPVVAEGMSSFGKRLNSDANTNLFITKNQMLEKNNYDRMETVMNSAGDRIRETPNEMMLGAETKTFNAQMDAMSGTMKPENVAKIKAAFYKTAGQQFIEGLSEKQQFGKALNVLRANQEDPNNFQKMTPDQALGLGFVTKAEAQALTDEGKTYDLPVLTKGQKVQLSPEISQVLKEMDPQDKARWIDHLQAKTREQSEIRLSDINAQVEGYERLSMAGQLPPNSDKMRQTLVAAINSNPQMTLAAKMRTLSRVNSAGSVNAAIALAGSVPSSQWSTVRESLDKSFQLANNTAARTDARMAIMPMDPAVLSTQMMQKARFDMAITNMAKDRQTDPAGAAISTDVQLAKSYAGTKDGDPSWSQKYAQDMLATQAYRQSAQGLIPKQDATRLGSMLKSAPDSDSTNAVMNRLQQQWGPYFPQVMQDIVKTDKDLGHFATAAYAPPETRGQLIDALKNEKTIRAEINSSPNADLTKASIKGFVSTQMQGFNNAIAASSNDSQRFETANNFSNAVSLVAQREILRGADPQSAVKRAYQNVVGAQYSIESGAQGAQVLVPRQMPDAKGNLQSWDTTLVKSYMDAYGTPEGYKALGVAVPKSSSSPNDFYQALQGNSRWISNQDQTGVQLMQVNRDGKLMPVYDKYGKTVQKSFRELQANPDERVLQQRQSFFGKMFGG